MTPRQESALELARLGFRIFPLRPGTKEPYRGEGWKAIMTTNEERIKLWFVERPDMNYAVVCDETHVILDPDEGFTKQGRKKGGIKNFLRAEDEALGFHEDSIFDNTVRIRTPKGGVHLYFSCEHAYKNSVSTIIDDVDVRGPDGYVVGPGCWTADDPQHNTVEGFYEIETDCDIAALPGWLKVKLDAGGLVGKRAENAGTLAGPADLPASIEKACKVLREREAAVEGQNGDDHTLKTAQQIGDEGVSEEKCLELMFSTILFAPDKDNPEGRTWNDMCEPPWDFDGLRSKVRNAYKYRDRQIGSKMDLLAAIGTEDPRSDSTDSGAETADSAASTDVAAAVEEVNMRYAMLVGALNGGRIVDFENPSVPTFIEHQRFEKIFANQKVFIVGANGKAKPITKAKLWMESPKRRNYSAIVFEPTGSHRKASPTEYNRWCGFAVRPKKGGSHEPLLTHILENICGSDAELYRWIMSWLADLVQKPGDKPGTAVVLRGTQGAGKSIIFEFLSKIFGPHALKLAQQSQITGKFNAHLASTIIVGVEEAFWAGDHDAEGILKDLITNPKHTIEAKFADITTSSNHTHLLITANAEWVVPASIGDRRYAVFGVSSRRANDSAFWDPIWDALHNEGPAHLLQHLLDYQYDRKAITRPPMTKAKIDQIEQSLSSVGSWWVDVLKENYPIVGAVGVGPFSEGSGDPFGTAVDKASVYGSFTTWCEKRRTRAQIPAPTNFWKSLRGLAGVDLSEHRPGSGSGRQRVVLLPTREICQAAFVAPLGCDWTTFDGTGQAEAQQEVGEGSTTESVERVY